MLGSADNIEVMTLCKVALIASKLTSEKSLQRSLCHGAPLSGISTLHAASNKIRPKLKISAGLPYLLSNITSGAMYSRSPSRSNARIGLGRRCRRAGRRRGRCTVACTAAVGSDACSGVMCAGEKDVSDKSLPLVEPCVVKCEPARISCAVQRGQRVAMPKSVIFSVPTSVIRILAGLRSRCKTPHW